MGSKLSLIISLLFSCFVFIFLVDLVSIQTNYSELESIASSITQLVATKGNQGISVIKMYLTAHKDTKVTFNNNIFKLGEFKEFSVEKEYKSIFLYSNSINLKVTRTAVVGQYEKENI